MLRDERQDVATRATAALALALATARTPEDSMAAVLEFGLPVVGASAGNVFLLDDTRGVLRLASTRGYTPKFMDAHALLPLDASLPAVHSVLDGQPRFLTTRDVERTYPWMPRDALGGGRIAALPLTVAGQHFGVIALTYPNDAPFTNAEREAHTTVAALCAQAVKRAQVSERAARDERRTVQVLETLGDAVVTIDAQEHVTFANSTARTWLGWDDAHEGRRLADLLHGKDAAALLDVVRAVHASRTAWRGEVCLLGGTRWFDTRVAPLDVNGSVVHLREVTHRKTVERQLNRSRERLLLALDAAAMAMWDWDLVTGELTWTGNMHALLGASPAVPVSFETFLARVHPDDRESLTKVVRDLMTRGGVYDQEFRVVHEDGTVRWLQGVGDVWTDGTRSVRSVGVNFDVTTRKHLERALRDANEHLEAQVAERTASLQDVNVELTAVAASLSRDLAEPVRRISGFLSLLARRYGPLLNEREAALFGMIRAEADRAATLVEELAHLTRHERRDLQVREVPLDLLVAQVVSDVAHEARGRTVTWVVGTLPVVRGDVLLLRHVFTVLLHNALKFTRPREEARVEVGSERVGNEVRVWVRDNGVGFPAEEAHRVFQMFTRLHADLSGPGVGLANVKRIVARHGGRVEAEGSVDRGAMFSVILPT